MLKQKYVRELFVYQRKCQKGEFVLQILKKHCLKIDVHVYLKVSKMFRMTSLIKLAHFGKISFTCLRSHYELLAKLRWRDICSRVIAYVTPASRGSYLECCIIQ